jgi:hypothetical protein
MTNSLDVRSSSLRVELPRIENAKSLVKVRVENGEGKVKCPFCGRVAHFEVDSDDRGVLAVYMFKADGDCICSCLENAEYEFLDDRTVEFLITRPQGEEEDEE